MKVVVTGASGFIGRPIVARLHDAGIGVRVIDTAHGISVTDADAMMEIIEGANAVIHLAGVLGTHELFDDVQKAIDVNITGSHNVIAACHKHDAHYIGITMPQVFPSIYTATKIASTKIATAYHHTYGLRVTHVRAFNAFGPGQAHGHGHPQKIIPTFATYAALGAPIPIWGDGEQGVDLIHTDELARIFECALAAPGKDETIDGGTGRGQRVIDVAREVCKILDVNPLIEYLPMRRGETPTQIVAEGEGWEFLDHDPRRISLDETVLWYADRAK